METKRFKAFRTRLSKKSYEELISIAVKQYKRIIALTGANNSLERKIKNTNAKVDATINKLDAQIAEVENFRIRVENAEKDNAELYVEINEKDATINKLQIAVYSMAIIICGLIVYIICLCGTCNNECSSEDIYYVACLNEVMCKDCIDDFVNNSTHYDDIESLEYEVQHFNFIADRLRINAHATISSNAIMLYNKDKTKEHFKNYDK